MLWFRRELFNRIEIEIAQPDPPSFDTKVYSFSKYKIFWLLLVDVFPKYTDTTLTLIEVFYKLICGKWIAFSRRKQTYLGKNYYDKRKKQTRLRDPRSYKILLCLKKLEFLAKCEFAKSTFVIFCKKSRGRFCGCVRAYLFPRHPVNGSFSPLFFSILFFKEKKNMFLKLQNYIF